MKILVSARTRSLEPGAGDVYDFAAAPGKARYPRRVRRRFERSLQFHDRDTEGEVRLQKPWRPSSDLGPR